MRSGPYKLTGIKQQEKIRTQLLRHGHFGPGYKYKRGGVCECLERCLSNIADIKAITVDLIITRYSIVSTFLC